MIHVCGFAHACRSQRMASWSWFSPFQLYVGPGDTIGSPCLCSINSVSHFVTCVSFHSFATLPGTHYIPITQANKQGEKLRPTQGQSGHVDLGWSVYVPLTLGLLLCTAVYLAVFLMNLHQLSQYHLMPLGYSSHAEHAWNALCTLSLPYKLSGVDFIIPKSDSKIQQEAQPRPTSSRARLQTRLPSLGSCP